MNLSAVIDRYQVLSADVGTVVYFMLLARPRHILADIICMQGDTDKRVVGLHAIELVEKIIELLPVLYFFGRV